MVSQLDKLRAYPVCDAHVSNLLVNILRQKSGSMEMALATKPDDLSMDPVDTALISDASQRSVVIASPSGKPVSVRDVARLSQVSPATVSLVINSNPRISPATHRRVRKVMEELGYRPNRLAQNLSRRATQMIAVMLPSLSHAFADRYFGELLSGICDRAAALDYKVMLEQATPQFIKNRKHIELFERRFIDGALCLGNSDRHPFLTDFAAGQHPMIAVNNYFPQWGLDHVVCDYAGGAEQAINYLFQLGHRRIGMIAGSVNVKTARDVVEAYERKLRQENIDPPAGWREDGLFTEEGGADAAQKLLTRHPELTAILTGNDKMALGALHYLTTAGKKVPGDVSVLGFDDMHQAAFANPSLTSVHCPLYEVGVLACEKLVARIQGNTDPIRTVLATHLTVRDSTGMARDSQDG